MNFDPNTITAITAITAIIFAVMEARIKDQGLRNERNILFYARYLYICQQIQMSVESVKKFVEIYKEFSKEEICGYSKAHMISNDFENIIYEFEEMSFNCFGEDIEKVQKALQFGSDASSLSETINSFYESMINQSYSNENLEKRTNKFESFLDNIGQSLNNLTKNNTDNTL